MSIRYSVTSKYRSLNFVSIFGGFSFVESLYSRFLGKLPLFRVTHRPRNDLCAAIFVDKDMDVQLNSLVVLLCPECLCDFPKVYTQLVISHVKLKITSCLYNIIIMMIPRHLL